MKNLKSNIYIFNIFTKSIHIKSNLHLLDCDTHFISKINKQGQTFKDPIKSNFMT